MKIKSEEEIEKMIMDKIREFDTSVLNQSRSPENDKINAELGILEAKLRKSYGFGKNEDLTVFPTFEFDEPKIDGQLSQTT